MSSSIPVIRIRCPNLLCGRVLAVPGDARGRLVRCGKCGTKARIPRSAINASKYAKKG